MCERNFVYGHDNCCNNGDCILSSLMFREPHKLLCRVIFITTTVHRCSIDGKSTVSKCEQRGFVSYRFDEGQVLGICLTVLAVKVLAYADRREDMLIGFLRY